MNPRLVTALGIVLALWIALGRWAFGIGGSLSWWYVPAIGLTFAVLQVWAARRIGLTRARGRRTRRPTVVALVLSWACAVAFGLTVPDQSAAGLMSILGLWGGPGWNEMSIALCNPFGIIAFALAIAAIAFASVDGRDPRPEEDELLDDDGEPRMVEHPLA